MQTRTPVSRVAYSALAAAAFTLIGPLAESAQAQLSPNGLDFQVNTYTTGDQHVPSVAGLGANGFVVVWKSYGSVGDDTSYTSIQGQRIGVDGALLGEQFQVNSFTSGSQDNVRVASDGASNFVVVWASSQSAGSDSSSGSIQGRRFSSAGVPLTADFQVNTYTEQQQVSPAVAVASSGEFVVVWTSEHPGPSSNDRSVQAQRFSSAGAALGGEFQVDQYSPAGSLFYPDVAALEVGGFVVTWGSFGSPGSDQDYSSIQARVYDANAVPADQIQVNSDDAGHQYEPTVASLKGGGFVVTWSNYVEVGPISMRRFDSAGLPLGAETQVNTSTAPLQLSPRIRQGKSGDIVATWSSSLEGDSAILARLFSADGTPRTGDFRVNSSTGLPQMPALAFDDSGNFLVTWFGPSSPGTDSSGDSIVARRVAGLFRDSFETGGLVRWSLVRP